MGGNGAMSSSDQQVLGAWNEITEAIAYATNCIINDPDPRNERETADGERYVMRILQGVAQSSFLSFDPSQPAFMPMLDTVRYLGAAGPDIDYDVAILWPGRRYRISGKRGGATYVGIAVYGHGGDKGATGIVAAIDVDELVQSDGSFVYDFDHPEASRVIIRQYFHNRQTQQKGQWFIEELSSAENTSQNNLNATNALPTVDAVSARISNAAQSIRWNAQLNQLWSPERRNEANQFIRQTADDIVAAIPNPDVMYSFSWWRLADDEKLIIEFTPPETKYWALQICDRWFQCFPDRRSNVNNAEVTMESDGSVRLVIAHSDLGDANWLSTSGHNLGVMFFRWLHADPKTQPICRVEKAKISP